ncbi:MAG: hypothetical protein II852_10700 [Bacteroidales bacterium]|nr:hypothetical protein [Bacteroidales bacterium]
MKRQLLTLLIVMLSAIQTFADGRFCIVKDGRAAQIVVSDNDWKGVIRAANDLGDDIRKVSGVASKVINNYDLSDGNAPVIIAGTIGKSTVIDRLVKQKKIDVSKVRGQWESYLIDIPLD